MITLQEALEHPLYSKIPRSILEDLYAYVEVRQPVGHFVGAVLSNDLLESFARADKQSADAMPIIVAFIWNEVRHDCYGSPEHVHVWLKGT